jgi:hypothetical protein
MKKKAHRQGPIRVNLLSECFNIMLEHCRRKLLGNFFPWEDQNKRAFGLLAGQKGDTAISVSKCFPLSHNARQSDLHRDYMDRMMASHAIPSETPLNDRGWVADPNELSEVLRKCRDLDLLLVGSYHMHRIAWPHDPVRDTPTELDTILGSNSRLLMFIISMVDPANPTLRVFDEGDIKREITIHYI